MRPEPYDRAWPQVPREAGLRLFLTVPGPHSLAPALYCPGIMRWAVVVPAFMIHAPPCLLLSGSPVDCVVAPGTATVVCARACSRSAPIRWYHIDPYSGFTRVPSFSMASSIACALALSPVASAFRFWATRSRLAILVHSIENGCWVGKPDRS